MRVTIFVSRIAASLLFACLLAKPVFAQFQTRTEAIEAQRRDKQARLWPERQSPLVDRVNDLVERGLYEGTRSGNGAYGWQLVMGGMRSGQGWSNGVGYRLGLFRDQFGLRTTARVTPQLAYLFDAQLDFQSIRSDRFFLDLYTKYESSPQMDYYGPGPDSLEENRTSYAYDTFGLDFRAGYNVTDWLRLGGTLGRLDASTGTGKRGGVPSTDEVFDPVLTPGLGEDTHFRRWGGFAELDFRDLPTGPRSGGYYAVTAREYDDVDQEKYAFSQVLVQAQQYLPYFNKTRVIAVRVAASLAFRQEDLRIPFYLQPSIGGNDDLRGFQRYRFYDDQALIVNVEHRWYASPALDMAIFADAGKVAPRLADVDFTDLEWSGGIGFRFKLQDAYVMRIDFAAGREGFRFMWTFSDIFRTRWGIYE
ncbi:MAG TPA: BamA/TamA family outer membrane protein [Vicinamibacteria bacterium]|nr:BamA/TamA family outer membrane protein [Vicinamibacteria bacterium]